MKVVNAKYHQQVLDNFDKLFSKQIEKNEHLRKNLVFFIEQTVNTNRLVCIHIDLDAKYRLYKDYKVRSYPNTNIFPVLLKIKDE